MWNHHKVRGKQQKSGMVTYMYNSNPCELRQKDGKFQASLGYTASPCLKRQKGFKKMEPANDSFHRLSTGEQRQSEASLSYVADSR